MYVDKQEFEARLAKIEGNIARYMRDNDDRITNLTLSSTEAVDGEFHTHLVEE